MPPMDIYKSRHAAYQSLTICSFECWLPRQLGEEPHERGFFEEPALSHYAVDDQ
jgi:hypothetical protein